MRDEVISERVLKQLAEKSAAAQSEVFRLLRSDLVRCAIKIVVEQGTAEDVVQNVFSRFCQRGFFFSSVLSLKSYLFTAVKNESVQSIRWQRRTNKHVQSAAYEGTGFLIPSDGLQNQALRALLAPEVNKLPTECRRVIIRLYFHHQTVNDIAEELGISISTVKEQKRRGLRKLRMVLLKNSKVQEIYSDYL